MKKKGACQHLKPSPREKVRNTCNACHAAYMKAYYWKNRDRWLANQRKRETGAHRIVAAKRRRDARDSGKLFCKRHGVVEVTVFGGMRCCRKCRVWRTKLWRKANPEAVRKSNQLSNKKKYQKDKVKILAQQRAYREAHPIKARRSARAWHAKHKGTPEYRAERKARKAKRTAIIRKATRNDFTAAQWQLLVRVFGGRCAYCLRKSVKLHADHIVPLSRGGDNTLTNIVPACARCNLKKGPATWKPVLKFGPYPVAA